MPRAVSQGQVMFNECIEEFRRSIEQQHEPYDISTCYLLTDFTLNEEWNLQNIKIEESTRIELANSQAAFVSRVHINDKCSYRTVHLYVTALASIMTFATGRRVAGPRDRYFSTPPTGDGHLLELALLLPILTAGPGCVPPFISRETFNTFSTSTEKLITKLRSIPYEQYILAMQAIRLIDLSIMNRRQDFGLAYFLIVGAIEAVAQVVIKRRSPKHPKEAEWKQRAAIDQQFSELLNEYKKARGNNQYLKERYAIFINTYAPPEIWTTLLPHPLQPFLDNLIGVANPDASTSPSFNLLNEPAPEDITDDEILQIIHASYKYRCHFVHRGEQPPHEQAPAYSHLFQEIREYDTGGLKVIRVLNYELLVGIARHSIMKWIDEIADEKT